MSSHLKNKAKAKTKKVKTKAKTIKTKYLNKTWLIIGAVIFSLIIIYLIYKDYKPELILLCNLTPHNRAILLQMIRSHGVKDMALLIALIAVFNAIPGMSNSVVCIFSGLCYGPVAGFFINWFGNILGNCAVMGIIRKIDISRRTKKSKLLDYLVHHKHPEIGLTFGYMIPVIPSILINYAGARLNVKRLNFLIMVAIGMAPTSFIYAFGGNALFKRQNKRLVAAVVAIVIIILAYFVIERLVKRYRVTKAKRA